MSLVEEEKVRFRVLFNSLRACFRVDGSKTRNLKIKLFIYLLNWLNIFIQCVYGFFPL